MWEVQNGLLGRRPPLTLVGPGNMVKFFCFTIERPMKFILQSWQIIFMVFASWIIDPGEEVGQVAGKIECRERIGGMLNYYYRDAA